MNWKGGAARNDNLRAGPAHPPCGVFFGKQRPGKALVVFSGRSDLLRLRLLKKGFRHCFLLLENEAGWTVLDPLSHRLDIGTLRGAKREDLMDWLNKEGMKIIQVETAEPRPIPAPLMLYAAEQYWSTEAVA